MTFRGHGALLGALALALALSALLFAAAPARAAFGIASLATTASNENGTPDFRAGSHPFSYRFDFAMNTDGEGQPEGNLRTVEVDLPPGLIGDPGAVPRCSRAEFDPAANCQLSSQVGLVEASVIGLGTIRLPLYNVTPPPGYVASFGGAAEGSSFIELVSVQGSGPGAHLRAKVSLLPFGSEIVHVTQTLWGVPADPGHDAERGECLDKGGTCPSGAGPAALLTLPVDCDGSPATTVRVREAGEPAPGLAASARLLGPGGEPQRLLGCDALPFSPTVAVGADGAALSPSGLQLDLRLPASEQPYGRAAAALRELTVRLPPGLAIDPSAGTGLEGCSPAQIGLTSAPGLPARFDDAVPACPAGARIGTVGADLPPLGEDISGSVYLAAPGQNPYAATFAFYLVLEDPARGLVVKVPGRFEPDPASGRLTAAITDLPEFPFAGVSLRFPSGPRAIFASPPACGAYLTTADLVPSTAPEGASATAQGRFTLGSGPGGPCPPPEAERNPAPSFAAEVEAPYAGAGAPLVIQLARGDADQHFGSFQLTLPPGLVANLGSTPVGAPVGSVEVGAGLGPQPALLHGTAYLGGPYRGAPYSLEIVVPARVGPFDLGTIVQRVAIEVDPVTARVSLASDPLPAIVAGVPLEIRSLTVDVDRPGFIRNPTSCEPMAIAGSATTALGQTAPLSTRFQVGACAALAFRPKLSLRFSGAVGRNGHPGIRAVLRGNPDGAAPAAVGFALPAGELLDLRHVRGLCPRDLAPSDCPRDSRLGTLRLDSPFVDGPLEGPVHLQVPRHRLPGLTAELRSGRLRFVLRGRTTAARGRLGVRFGSLPDIPLSRAVLTLAGGRRGIVVNSRSLCSRPGAVSVTATAHNGKRRAMHVAPRLPGRC